MEELSPDTRRDVFGPKINRTHSPALAVGIPWIVILLACMAPLLPVITPAPIMPPFGFLFMLGWQLARPGLLPLWAGLPLGLFDDLFSGQPLGSAIVLFSLTLIVLDQLDARLPWRYFWQDWGLVALLVTAYLFLAAVFSGADISLLQLQALLPQLLFSVLLFPIIVRMIAVFDRLRLMRVRRIG